jgi:hypothetical protein
MRIRIATTVWFGLPPVLGGCSSSTGPGNEEEFDKVPTSISIGRQPVELSALAVTDSSGASLLRVGAGLFGDSRVAGVSADRLWVLVGDRVWETAVTRTPIPEDYYYWAVDGIEWDPAASFEVVAQLRHESGKRFLVRDAAVLFTHGDPAL